MKVFAGFIRKYYQSFFGFLSRSIAPIFSSHIEADGGLLFYNTELPLQSNFPFHEERGDSEVSLNLKASMILKAVCVGN